jgi:aspartate/methionine/tyrosine aminotransferase
MFSYAGERVGLLVTSRALAARSYECLHKFFDCANVAQALKRAVFNLSAGAPHSAQLAMAAAFNESTRGSYALVETLSEYGRRGRSIKKILLQRGFYMVYSGNQEDCGFYLTFAYPGFNAKELLKELLCHGITALPLHLFGSSHPDGLRACVGLLGPKDLDRFEQRIENFARTQARAAKAPWPLTLEANRKD